MDDTAQILAHDIAQRAEDMLMAQVGVECPDRPWKEAVFYSIRSACYVFVPLRALTVQIC